MSGTYLVTHFRDRERVKALGARWDPDRRQWYVPDALELAPFADWLPEGVRLEVAARALPLAAETLPATSRGISLSQLMAGVVEAVSQAFRAGVWTRVELNNVRANRGNVHLELAERSADGQAIAQARGVIWADTANQIVAAFQEATGVVLGSGIKLLVRARPNMHASYGLSLVIDAIDHDYTLGDLEARKREIRTRLQTEGLLECNRQLPAPWDYRDILVLAPEGAAGLGDFMAEAKRMERHGLCRFEVVNSRFQGDGAADEMRHVLLNALAARDEWSPPDAVVIIRGGGAVNDLAWLNDYALARCICELHVPVLTGIGHERDNTILDEVAHTRYDTPSKVILGIEQIIVARAREARRTFEAIRHQAERALAQWRELVRLADAQVREGARQQLARARIVARDRHDEVREAARQCLASARETNRDLLEEVRRQAGAQVRDARQQVPQFMAEIRVEARQAVRTAMRQTDMALVIVGDQARSGAARERQRIERTITDVGRGAMLSLRDARERSDAHMREIVGQGPDKTLRRGFALVRDDEGRALTSAEALRKAMAAQIQFSDGSVPASVRQQKKG